MGVRTALEQSKILMVVILGAFAWLFLTLLTVVRNINWLAVTQPEFIGQNALGGIIGAIVLTIMLGILVTLYGGISETDPSPGTWPPSE